MLLQEAAEQGGGVFAEFAIFGAEGSQEVGVDVEFAGDFAADEDGDDDFGFCFERAGEIARVCVDVVHDDGFATGGRGAADALIERDARVGRHGAFEGAEHEDVAAFLFQHKKANPIVFGEFFVEQRDDGFHERFAGRGGFGESVEFGNQIAGFEICGGHFLIFAHPAGRFGIEFQAVRSAAKGAREMEILRGELTGRRAATKLLKLSSRGSSLVERRPEKAGVASSILAPGTI
jgi:hypothetical protein